MDEKQKVLNGLVAGLRALYLIHQHSHWKSHGMSFYGDHLMFQRIYESAAADADSLAERLIGLYGNDAMDLAEQSALMSKLTAKYTGTDVVANSLKAETDCKNWIGLAIPKLQSVSPGLDNLLRDIYDNREGNLYLLKQRSA